MRPEIHQPTVSTRVGAVPTDRYESSTREALVGRGDITEEEYEASHRDFQDRLERAFMETHAAQTSSTPIVPEVSDATSQGRSDTLARDNAIGELSTTGVSEAVVHLIGDAFNV